MIKENLTWKDIHKYCKNLLKVKNDFDYIVAISKGGCIPGTIIANKLKKPMFVIGVKSYENFKQNNIELIQPFNFNEQKNIIKNINEIKILLIDDICDTGNTINFVVDYLASQNIDKKNIFISTIINYNNKNVNYFYKTKNVDWIVFPWEK